MTGFCGWNIYPVLSLRSCLLNGDNFLYDVWYWPSSSPFIELLHDFLLSISGLAYLDVSKSRSILFLNSRLLLAGVNSAGASGVI